MEKIEISWKKVENYHNNNKNESKAGSNTQKNLLTFPCLLQDQAGRFRG